MTEETTRLSESSDDASFDAEFEALPSATLERPVVAGLRPSHAEIPAMATRQRPNALAW